MRINAYSGGVTNDGKAQITVDRNPGMLYHDDAGVESLAGVISEKIDWTAPDEH